MGTEENQYCDEHKECKSRIDRNENDIQSIWKEVNTMKMFVIGGMLSVALQLIIFVGRLLLNT